MSSEINVAAARQDASQVWIVSKSKACRNSFLSFMGSKTGHQVMPGNGGLEIKELTKKAYKETIEFDRYSKQIL